MRLSSLLAALLVMAASAASLSGCATNERVKSLEARILELEKKVAEGKFNRISIVDEKGKEHAILGLRKDGTPHLKVVDGKGANRFLLRLHPDGTPVLVLWGKGTKSSAYLSVPGEGPPQMMMFNKEGKQVFKAP